VGMQKVTPFWVSIKKAETGLIVPGGVSPGPQTWSEYRRWGKR